MPLAFPKPLPPAPKRKERERPEHKRSADREMERWREHVRAQAGNVCEMAGIQHECRGPLDGAHVIGRGRQPRLRVDRENGVLLCRAAHDLYDRTRWFKPHFNAWIDARYPGRRARLLAKAQREARLMG